MVNSISISGCVVYDVEMRYIPNGTAVSEFTIKNQNGKRSTYVKIEAWDKLAERLAERLRKGDEVVVHGALIEHNWKDRDGKKHSRMKIRAKNVIPIDNDDDDEKE